MAASKKDVATSSFSFNAWQRLRNTCLVLKQTEINIAALKAEIDEKLQATHNAIKKKGQVQACQISLESLNFQLDSHRARVRTLGAKINQLAQQQDRYRDRLKTFSLEIQERQNTWTDAQQSYFQLRERLLRSSAQLVLRRKQLVHELATVIYPIGTYTKPAGMKACKCTQPLQVMTAHLPNAESYGSHDDHWISVALGYVAHSVLIISCLLNLPLRYPLYHFGSRSAAEDITSHRLVERVFPLFSKGQDQIRYEYAIFLLNKNIAQLRCSWGMSTPDLRRTLANLKDFQDCITSNKLDLWFGGRPLIWSTPASSTFSLNSSLAGTLTGRSDTSQTLSNRRLSSDLAIQPPGAASSRRDSPSGDSGEFSASSPPVHQRLHAPPSHTADSQSAYEAGLSSQSADEAVLMYGPPRVALANGFHRELDECDLHSSPNAIFGMNSSKSSMQMSRSKSSEQICPSHRRHKSCDTIKVLT